MDYASVFREGLFSGQVVLVTGGGTGIGRCVAHELAALGATPVLAARREEPLRRTVAEIAEAGRAADWAQADIRQAEEVDALVATVIERHGRLDAVVNNAGGQFPSPAADITPNGWRSVVDLNLNGTFLVTRACFNAWFAEHGGAVVSVTADVRNGFPFFSHTGAARAGVSNLTKTLAVEWAAHHVRVNAVAPGVIWSSGMDSYDPEFLALASESARGVPAGRLGTESEVSAAVCYLLSPAAAFVTGVTLRVDGGAPLLRQPPFPMGLAQSTEPFDGFHLAREAPPPPPLPPPPSPPPGTTGT